jgi:hypothetical protein
VIVVPSNFLNVKPLCFSSYRCPWSVRSLIATRLANSISLRDDLAPVDSCVDGTESYVGGEFFEFFPDVICSVR